MTDQGALFGDAVGDNRKPWQRTDFDGETFEPELDAERLGTQMRAVFSLMSDGQWRTLNQISALTGYPEASVSARLRDLRKVKFGHLSVERRRVDGGLWVYRVTMGVVPRA